MTAKILGSIRGYGFADLRVRRSGRNYRDARDAHRRTDATLFTGVAIMRRLVERGEAHDLTRTSCAARARLSTCKAITSRSGELLQPHLRRTPSTTTISATRSTARVSERYAVSSGN